MTSDAQVIPFPEPEPGPEDRPVLVLDLGGQYAQLIARRVRECRVYSELVGHEISAAEARRRRPSAVILSGGPASVYAEAAPRIDPGLYDLGVPVLGICYGVQLTALLLGGQVAPATHREYGRATVKIKDTADLFHGFAAGEEMPVWMSHGDRVETLPAGFEVVGESVN